MKLNYVSKHKIKEILSSIIFFVVFFVINILLSEVDDFPMTRIILAAIIFSLMMSYYELILRDKLHEYFSPPLVHIIGFIYTIVVFSLLLLLFVLAELLFKVEIPLQKISTEKIFSLLPENIQMTFFSLFMFLTIRYLANQFKIRNIKGTLKSYLFKKPGEPIVDSRIFMFMDLKSSTSFAEKLGYVKYSKFIQEIYNELDEFVLQTRGSIYQYVGDEVVLVWSKEEGIKDNNCIKFFFLFENRLEQLREKFLREYGVFPEFKAGFHYGDVAIADIGGILRKDIAFHGDTVNTTARICSKCTQLGENVLISKDLVLKLPKKPDQFESAGVFKLKGKKIETELFKINNLKFEINEYIDNSRLKE